MIRLQPFTSDMWKSFAYELNIAIGALEEDEFLIVLIKRSNFFVQFSEQGASGMRIEAVSNFYLPEGQSLIDAQHEALLQLGWKAPTNLPDGLESSHRPDGSANYFLDVAKPVKHALLAVLAVNTLGSVYGALHPGQLQYTSFSEGGTSIRFPALGIRRQLESA